MGTRADFYVGRGEAAEWLGSIAWDGYPEGLPASVLRQRQEAEYRADVVAFIASKEDGTSPEQGWPWPWDDSGTTDYAYAFDEGRVWASSFGTPWFDPTGPEPEDMQGPLVAFPAMGQRRRVVLQGPRSGLSVVVVRGP